MLGGGLSPFGQQPSLLDAFAQQQMAMSMALQQAQLVGQIQAAGQQQAALAAAAAARQQANREAAASRRKQSRLESTEPEELFAKPEFKPLEDDSEEAASARLLLLAKNLKKDSEMADFSNDRQTAARLRSRVGQRLTEIIDKYPKTRAAKQAQSLLETLYQ